MTAAALAIALLLIAGLILRDHAATSSERTLLRATIEAQRAHLVALADLREMEIDRAHLEHDLAAVTAERDAAVDDVKRLAADRATTSEGE